MDDSETLLSAKWFVFLFVGFIVLMLAFLYGIHKQDIPYFDNDVIRQYQLKKLKESRGIETIIVGDSSAGNAIDAGVFTALSSQKTLNLALSGSFGFEGSFNMVRHALKTQPIKNVIIIQSLDQWRKPFDQQAYFESLEGLSNLKALHGLLPSKISEEYARYLINPKEAWWWFSYRRNGFGERASIERENDYSAQTANTYASGWKTIAEDARLSPTIHEDRKKLFSVIDQFCVQENLNCIYAHGPLHETIAKRSQETINAINTFIHEAKHIIPVERVFMYPNEKMGDSIDHAHSAFKKEVTREYFEVVANRLTPSANKIK